MKKPIVMAAAVIALAAGSISTAQAATAPFNATIAGIQGTGRTPLAALAQSSTLTIDVANLPANVGLYALHCALPADPRQAPTQCDESADALVYVPATAAERPSLQVPIRVHAEFTGINPNPQAGSTAVAPIDCRAVTCAVYVLGAGRESANPAYIRVWPTQFSPLTKPRKDDAVTITVAGTTIAPSTSKRPPTVSAKPVAISVKTASGLVPNITGTNCSVKDGTLTPLVASGSCVLRISTTGGTTFKPITVTQVLKIGTKPRG